MDNKLYYEFLDTLGDKKNLYGFVAFDMPFLKARNAIEYVVKYFPDIAPADHPVVYDPKRCAVLSLPLYREVERLVDQLDGMKDEQRKKLDSMSEKLSHLSDKDLLESVHKSVLHECLHEQIGICEGLSKVWEMLNQREYELFRCSRLKEAEL